MTIKELSQLYWLNKEVEADQKRLDDLTEEIKEYQQQLINMRQEVSVPSGSSLTGMPRSPSQGNKIERYVGNIVDLERLIVDKRKALSEYAMAIIRAQTLVIHKRNELEQYINSIEDGYMRRVFYNRFIGGLNWAQIAERLAKENATEDSVKRRFYRYARKNNML